MSLTFNEPGGGKGGVDGKRRKRRQRDAAKATWNHSSFSFSYPSLIARGGRIGGPPVWWVQCSKNEKRERSRRDLGTWLHSPQLGRKKGKRKACCSFLILFVCPFPSTVVATTTTRKNGKTGKGEAILFLFFKVPFSAICPWLLLKPTFPLLSL